MSSLRWAHQDALIASPLSGILNTLIGCGVLWQYQGVMRSSASLALVSTQVPQGHLQHEAATVLQLLLLLALIAWQLLASDEGQVVSVFGLFMAAMFLPIAVYSLPTWEVTVLPVTLLACLLMLAFVSGVVARVLKKRGGIIVHTVATVCGGAMLVGGARLISHTTGTLDVWSRASKSVTGMGSIAEVGLQATAVGASLVLGLTRPFLHFRVNAPVDIK